MSDLQKINYAMQRVHKKAVASFEFKDWEKLVCNDGSVTKLNQLPGPLDNNHLKACTITTVASGIANPCPGIDVVRLDENDYPYVINIDHYSVIENLPSNSVYT